MIALAVYDGDARNEPIALCPICNSKARNIEGEGTDYLCGARTIAASHGSWSIAIPCPAEPPSLDRNVSRAGND